MTQFDQPIPAAQAVLDTHVIVRRKIEAANQAVLDAVKSMIEFGDPTAGNVFGADYAALQKISETNKSKLMPILMTGIPIFSLRIATPEFKAVLDNNEGEDAGLLALLKTFGQNLNVVSL